MNISCEAVVPPSMRWHNNSSPRQPEKVWIDSKMDTHSDSTTVMEHKRSMDKKPTGVSQEVGSTSE